MTLQHRKFLAQDITVLRDSSPHARFTDGCTGGCTCGCLFQDWKATDSPRMLAIREAAARAATRRGSKTKMKPPSSTHAEPPRRASGTAVVFPAPGGASSTAHGVASSDATNLGSNGAIGRDNFALSKPLNDEVKTGSLIRRELELHKYSSLQEPL